MRTFLFALLVTAAVLAEVQSEVARGCDRLTPQTEFTNDNIEKLVQSAHTFVVEADFDIGEKRQCYTRAISIKDDTDDVLAVADKFDLHEDPSHHIKNAQEWTYNKASGRFEVTAYHGADYFEPSCIVVIPSDNYTIFYTVTDRSHHLVHVQSTKGYLLSLHELNSIDETVEKVNPKHELRLAWQKPCEDSVPEH